MLRVVVNFSNRVNSAFCLRFTATMFHTISHSMCLYPRTCLVLPNYSSAIVDQTPRFNDTEFVNNFSQSFLNFVITMDPNIKWDPSNTLPQWPEWTEKKTAEMLFNRTEAGVPIFKLSKTSERMLNRCAWVLTAFLDHVVDIGLRFWESISATIRQ